MQNCCLWIQNWKNTEEYEKVKHAESTTMADKRERMQHISEEAEVERP